MRKLAALLLAVVLAGCVATGDGFPCRLTMSYDPTTGAFTQSCTFVPVVEPTPVQPTP